MGLDVYLHHCPNRAEVRAIEERHSKESEANWKKIVPGKTYETLTEGEKAEVRKINKKLAEDLGLTGKYETHPSDVKIEENSKLYPDHYFKVGYFRSSYNDSGINHVFRNLGLPTLDDLFDVKDNSGRDVVPDWKNVLERTNQLIEKYKEVMSSSIGGIRMTTVRMNMFSQEKPPSSEEEALNILREQFKIHEDRKKDDDNWYSTGVGDFSLGKPMQVVGIIPGVEEEIISKVRGQHIPQPVTYIAYRLEDGGDWHLHALEIVKETIEYVLAQPDPEHYYLVWSC